MARNRDYSYTVGVDADKGISNLNALKRAAKEAGKELDDGASNAEAFATAMKVMADKAERDLDAAAAAAEELGRALGPELAAKLEQNGIDQIVADLNRAGLSFDEIRADADLLADGIRRLDQVTEKAAGSIRQIDDAADQAADGIRRVNTEADKSGSVMANTVGNASQDLADSFGLAGVAGGTLGVTIGQLGEYAAESGISMAGLRRQAVRMAAVVAVVAAISHSLSEIKQQKAWESAQLEAYKKALVETRTNAEAMYKVLDDAGKIEFSLGNDKFDFTQQVADAGLTLEQFTNIATGGQDAITSWGNAALEAGVSADTVGAATLAMSLQADRLASAQKGAAAYVKVFGAGAEDAADKTDRLSNSVEIARDAIDRYKDALDAAFGAQVSAAEAQVQYRDSALATTNAVNDYVLATLGLNSTNEESRTTLDEVVGALNSAELAIYGQADAARTAAEAQAAANGITDTAAIGAAAYRDELKRVASTLAPEDPLRRNLEGLIGDLDSLPDNTYTTVNVDTSTASERIAALRTQLGDLMVALGSARSGYADPAAAARYGKGPTAGTASGGPVQAGVPGRVVEVGRPEIFRAGGQDYLLSPESGQVRPAAAGGGAAQVINYNTIQLPAGFYIGTIAELGERIDEALTRWVRSGGTPGFTS